MTKTEPEGFLVCHNVPIARTGWQQYLPREMGLPEDSGMVRVERTENEVFSSAAIASFEGKPVTDGHPPGEVDPSNYAAYTKGHVSNVRRGADELADYLVADLIIYDAVLIAEIEAGKREVSCGYDCKYIENGDGAYRQVDIAGNHVAIVNKGRAGNTVAIRDAKPKEEKTRMSVKREITKKGILAKMLSAFAKDADPEEVQQAADAIYGDEKPVETPAAEKTADSGVESALQALTSRLDALEAKLSQPAKDDLESLEEELSKPATEDTEEASVTVPAEKIADEEPDKTSTADKAPILSLIKTLKPVVANLPPEQRRTVADAMGKALRDAMVVKPTQDGQGNAYAQMLKRKTKDNKPAQDKGAYGEACRKRNPHYKGDK